MTYSFHIYTLRCTFNHLNESERNAANGKVKIVIQKTHIIILMSLSEIKIR